MPVLNHMHTPRFLASALVALWLGGLHRLAGRGAKRLRAREIPALLEREDTLIVDTETTGIGRGAEVIELVAIDTTGTLRLSALSIPVGPISHESWEIHGLSLEALDAQGARPWLKVHQEFAALLRDAQWVLAWRADFDARVLRQTAAAQNLELPPIEWADVRPAYVDARPRGPHSLADAMRREGLRWEGRHHRAEADCRSVLTLMRRMAEEAR